MGSLHDAYELGGVAGHGRTSLVRLGVRRGDCSPVALKQLRIEHAPDPDKRARFVEQARRACMLQHEGIEQVLDVVDGPDGPIAVTEWIDGRSLHRLALARRRRDEPWPALEVALVARSLLEALRHAHHQRTAFDAQGMLHGGLWPGNVLVDVEGNIKLVDFGMASVWQEAREPWQDLDALRYLSADHVRHGATAASDLYAVGAIVHELLSGQRFRDEYETEADMRTAIDRADPPGKPREDVPIQLERLRRRLLERVPNPRLTLEHMLDLCAAIPQGDAREDLASLVKDTLRNDSTSPDPEPTPPRGIPISVAAEEADREPPRTFEGVATARQRPSAAVHFAAGINLEQVPLGQSPRPPRRRDTQSVPVPVDHEQTAPRAPRFLQQTTPPVSEETLAAERLRSGSGELELDDEPADAEVDEPDGYDEPDEDDGASDEDDDGAPRATADADTAPIVFGDAAVPEPIPEDDDAPDLLTEPDVTSEVTRIARLPEDDSIPSPAVDLASVTERVRPRHRGPRAWLRGPLGWALLGAAAVGLGVPLLSRCHAEPTEARLPVPARTH
ncbi:serine/threonine protein kinase [Paraliomyxa miuraensis]|uniref:serine/threonine protein kinase n=1 Tax=Paraliomyxa miuraensis TaxID=376150 RepID=UPI0022535BE6|nr:protein kinase [Paraliomyxa miuraensis]MCX4246296.1 protein kinase [Paraliomyxa miuraensis]